MTKRILMLVFIFVCAGVAWVILGSVTYLRTDQQDASLKSRVGKLWGSEQRQQAPIAYYREREQRQTVTIRDNDTLYGSKLISVDKPLVLASSDIAVRLDVEHRKKGLLWYPTYRVQFSGTYSVENDTDQKRDIYFDYAFPNPDGLYDNFRLVIDGEELTDLRPDNGAIVRKIPFEPGAIKQITISYGSQGMDQWWYFFGENISQLRNFNLVMETNFDDVDFPENSISPTFKEQTPDGWRMTWDFDNLISGIQIGMVMPQKLNPGPFAGRVTFFAPISLFLFFFLTFIITTVKKINLHPMNYFFLAAAFFSFHLLLAYLVDLINIHLAMAICSVVSILLVISYMRLVVGVRFALVEVGLSQFVYLVLFSYAFFLEGYTGLSITVCCILTLFVVMQFTGKIDWDAQFGAKGGSGRSPVSIDS